MTTIACNLKEMAGDTNVTCEGVGTDIYSAIKIFAANGSLYGLVGDNCVGQLRALEWLQQGAILANRPEPPKKADWMILELSKTGIVIYDTFMEREETLNTYIALGSGRKVAMFCMKYLGYNPVEAVDAACKADHWTDHPIYHASLAKPTVRKWDGKKRRTSK